MQDAKFIPSKAFSSQYNEISLDKLDIIGEIPKWLSGSFISNGPGQFEVGSTQFNHWFDGFAMLKKFEFKSGDVCFQNRFLQSKEYVGSNNLGQLNTNEFGTYARKSKAGRLLSSINELIFGAPHDNCLVNTTCINDTYIAMTESNALLSFDIRDLSTLDALNFDDKIRGQLTTAHPHFDFSRGEFINISIEIGKRNQYHIYKLEPLTRTRKIIQTYVCDRLFYIHSFSITNNYIILLKSPLILNKYKLMLGLPFNNNLSYQQDTSSFFVIINRKNGKIEEIETDPFVCVHTINAYDHKNEITVDLVCHQTGNPYDKLYLSNLCSRKPDLPAGEIRRYIIDTHSKSVAFSALSPHLHEFPRINYKRCNANEYQFAYTSVTSTPEAPFFNAIHKLNTQTGSVQLAEKKNYQFGEAVFVPRPNAQSEDDGILLSIAFNECNQFSSLMVVDAISMQVAAEISLPLHLPFGLHGNFYKKL